MFILEERLKINHLSLILSLEKKGQKKVKASRKKEIIKSRNQHH